MQARGATTRQRAEAATTASGLSVIDYPSAYMPGDRRRALAAGEALPSHVTGASLFADISGFTALTEALASELGSQRASEVLTGHLNRVFHAVIAELDRFGGEVIYFSGDAITCWLDGDDGTRATASGLAMQGAMAREGEIRTPAGLAFQLALKVAVVTGHARRFVVGDPAIQLIDVLAGALIDRLTATERLAQAGEVVVGRAVAAALAGSAEVGERRRSDAAGPVTVVTRLHGEVPDVRLVEDDLTGLPEAIARQWLLPAVYERLSAGRGQFLAELRSAYPIFVSFRGIHYVGDAAGSEELDAFVRAAQQVLSGYGGNVLQLTLGDKGAYLYGVFGTPYAHEDDADRVCAAALELQGLERTTAAREIRVGIAHGRLRSGTYGHARRRTFVCLGDAVNLAARLMSKAPPGEIYVSELVRRRTAERFTWKALEPLQLKGKAAPVGAHSLAGASAQHTRRVVRYALPIVGRSSELAALQAALADSAAGRGQTVGISAEAGMGKSRLIAEFVRNTRGAGITVAFGECQAFGTSTSYYVWREIWRSLLGIPQGAPDPEQIAALERSLRAIDPAFVQRAPLLDVVLGITIPDNPLTSTFDPKLRKTSVENLLGDCLRARAAAEPLVLVLEDCHWLDPLSRELLDVIARTAATAPVLIVCAYRPDAALSGGLALGALHGLQELPLSALAEEDMTAAVREKLRALLEEEPTDPDRPLIELVAARAQGNPLYAEELLNFIHASGIDRADEIGLRSLDLPDSLQSLILSRIDTLQESSRRTLKLASVIGRVFQAPALPVIYRDLVTIDGVRSDLDTLLLLDLVIPDREEDESRLFKHALTQAVVYESLPYGLRTSLHGRVGKFLEARGPDAIERNLDLLAHHYWHSKDEAKKRLYLGRAAEAAKAAYANAAAIDYYERLAPLLGEGERIDALLELGGVLELVGEWDRAYSTEMTALGLAEEIGDDRARARCETALADVAWKQARYEEAGERLARAAATFEAVGDDRGLGRVAHIEGTLAAQRGDLVRARRSYEQSLAIRRRLRDRPMMASVLSNLGIVAEYEADYVRARSLHAQSLALRRELGDRWAIANSMTNLGMIALLEGQCGEARARFEEAMSLYREVGDSRSVALSDNNLGNATRDLGDLATAAEHYRASLRAYRDYGDKWALAFLLEDVGRFGALLGEAESALELVGAAHRLREEIGAPRAESLEAEIAKAIGPATAQLGADEQAAIRMRGRALDLAAAVDAALSLVAAGDHGMQI